MPFVPAMNRWAIVIRPLRGLGTRQLFVKARAIKEFLSELSDRYFFAMLFEYHKLP